MSAVRARLGGAAKASRPDGTPGRSWALATRVLGDRMGRLFTACLRSGAFSSRWRRANLVLLQKDGKPPEQPSAYRPICLLDEAAAPVSPGSPVGLPPGQNVRIQGRNRRGVREEDVPRGSTGVCFGPDAVEFRLPEWTSQDGESVVSPPAQSRRSRCQSPAPLHEHRPIGISLRGTDLGKRLMANKRASALVRKADRRMAIRVARCYRTVSYVASTTLAKVLPFDLVASSRAEAYRCAIEVGRSGISPEIIPKKMEREKARARRWALREWKHRLGEHNTPGLPELKTVETIQPCLQKWVGRRGGGISFCLAQVFTGYDCFGDYLCRIGKQRTTRCYHCAANRDSAQHTLEECPAWTVERRALVEMVGGDLSLPSLIRGMLEREESWVAVSSFCETVMSRKEKVERERRGEGGTTFSQRRRRRGQGGGRIRPCPPRLGVNNAP
ncbi:uncharacterized protein [Linepithema humile]|uniref:uncharacterized protein n=1 Tax=Linepithema humile TaxID=83485 RepID=UPI00351DEE21